MKAIAFLLLILSGTPGFCGGITFLRGNLAPSIIELSNARVTFTAQGISCASVAKARGVVIAKGISKKHLRICLLELVKMIGPAYAAQMTAMDIENKIKETWRDPMIRSGAGNNYKEPPHA